MQKKTIEKNVHFEETIHEFKNIVKKRLKIIEHVNVIIFPNQSQSQSQFQSKKSTFSISSENDKSEKRQCSCDVMHDLKNCDHFVKSVKSSNWKYNSQKRKWIKDAIKKNRNFYHAIKKITNIDILNDIKKEDCKWK
jgi:ERCC4-related helicase